MLMFNLYQGYTREAAKPGGKYAHLIYLFFK